MSPFGVSTHRGTTLWRGHCRAQITRASWGRRGGREAGKGGETLQPAASLGIEESSKAKPKPLTATPAARQPPGASPTCQRSTTHGPRPAKRLGNLWGNDDSAHAMPRSCIYSQQLTHGIQYCMHIILSRTCACHAPHHVTCHAMEKAARSGNGNLRENILLRGSFGFLGVEVDPTASFSSPSQCWYILVPGNSPFQA